MIADVENNTHSPSLLEGYECSDSDSDYTPSEHDQSQDSDDDLNEGGNYLSLYLKKSFVCIVAVHINTLLYYIV